MMDSAHALNAVVNTSFGSENLEEIYTSMFEDKSIINSKIIILITKNLNFFNSVIA
tara:strand:- start:191 stop:358 length:168 start_codon:yes stop_codon:yes gene_type:complete